MQLTSPVSGRSHQEIPSATSTKYSMQWFHCRSGSARRLTFIGSALEQVGRRHRSLRALPVVSSNRGDAIRRSSKRLFGGIFPSSLLAGPVRHRRAADPRRHAVPAAHDSGRNWHRSGVAWSKGANRAILKNPRYAGRQVWNRQRKDEVPDRRQRRGPGLHHQAADGSSSRTSSTRR
jgi:hypothetical protein